MDKLKDSLSMEKLDDRDLLNIDLGSEGGSRDPNVQVFEQKQSYSTSNKKLVTNDFSTEEATANSEQMTHLQEGDNSYRENKASSDMRAKLEMNGVTAEKGLSTRQVSSTTAQRTTALATVLFSTWIPLFSFVLTRTYIKMPPPPRYVMHLSLKCRLFRITRSTTFS